MAVHVPQQMCGIDGTWGEGLMGDLLGLDVFLGVLQVPWGAIVLSRAQCSSHDIPHLSCIQSLELPQLNDAS